MLTKVEDGQSKHAAKFGEALFAPLFPGVHENFGVRLGIELMAEQLQPIAEFAVVVKLAIENSSDVLRFIPKRLMAAGEINDTETPHAQSEAGSPGIDKEAFVVRTTMAHGGGHGVHADRRIRTARSERDATNAAHFIF